MPTKAELEQMLAETLDSLQQAEESRIAAERRRAEESERAKRAEAERAELEQMWLAEQNSKSAGDGDLARLKAAMTVEGVETRPTAGRELVEACLAPFEGDALGKLPRSGCADCKKAGKWNACDRHHWVERGRCPEDGCPGNHESSTVHLDFVGHADVTKRLLDIDPYWTWEPMGFAADGTPAIQVGAKTASMWIRLTVSGRTMLGVGTAPRDKEDMVKELIGDALRNAGMRLGIALELWAKGDREWNRPEEAESDPDIAVEKASAEQRALIGKRIKAVKDDEIRGLIIVELKQIYGSASDMAADKVDVALAHIATSEADHKRRRAEEAAAAVKRVEEAVPGSTPVDPADIPADAETVDLTGAANSAPEPPAEEPAVIVPEKAPAPAAAESEAVPAPEGATNIPVDGAVMLAELRDVFMQLGADDSIKAKAALANAGFFPLKRIDPADADAAMTVLNEAIK